MLFFRPFILSWDSKQPEKKRCCVFYFHSPSTAFAIPRLIKEKNINVGKRSVHFIPFFLCMSTKLKYVCGFEDGKANILKGKTLPLWPLRAKLITKQSVELSRVEPNRKKTSRAVRAVSNWTGSVGINLARLNSACLGSTRLASA